MMIAVRRAWRMAAWACAVMLAPHAVAGSLTGFFEIGVLDSESSDEFAELPAVESETRAVLRRLSISFFQQAYPLVSFWGGGTFDDIDQTFLTADDRFDTDEQRLRPYLGVARRTETWNAQLQWNLDRQRVEPESGGSLTFTRQSLFGTASWNPPEALRESWPYFRVSASHTTDQESTRSFRDTVGDFFDLEVSQNRLAHWRYSYRSNWSDQRDRIFDSEVQTWSHAGTVSYENRWRDRVEFFGEYGLTYRDTTLRTSGGELDAPLFTREGLVSRTDIVLLDTLAPAPGLNDDDLTTPTAVDLGVPPVGGDERPWSLGLDLGSTTTLDTLFVWTDREIRLETAAVFSWQVYVSANNLEWQTVGIVSAAPYDPFLRRFRVAFGEVAARYVKLVVRPLRPGDPFVSELDDLFVTELDAILRTSLPGNRLETDATFQTLNANVRARLLANRDLYYEGSIDVNDGSGQDYRYRMSNGLFYTQPVSRTATWSTRVSWEEYKEEQGNDRAFVYTTALTSQPVERLRYSVSLSGREEQIGDLIGGDQIGVYFYGSATLWDGVDAQVGLGRSYLEDGRGQTVEATQANAALRLAPRDDLAFGLTYVDSLSEAVDSPDPLGQVFTRASEANVTYTPVPTLYLFGSYRLEWRDRQPRDEVVRWIASWSPFPGGAVRLGLNYDETRREIGDQYVRVYGPSVRWQINPRSYIEGSYLDVTDESDLRRFYNEVYTATLRWGF